MRFVSCFLFLVSLISSSLSNTHAHIYRLEEIRELKVIQEHAQVMLDRVKEKAVELRAAEAGALAFEQRKLLGYFSPESKQPVPQNFTQIQVGAAKDFMLSKVLEKGTAVSWIFRTLKHNICFSAWFQPNNGGRQVVEETMKVESNVTPVCGEFVAETSGSLVLCWDNTFSFFTEKVVQYRLFDVSPDLRGVKLLEVLQQLKVQLGLDAQGPDV